MFAEEGLEPASMLTELAGRGVETNRCQFAFAPRLIHPEVLTEGVIANAGEAANLLVSKTLTFQPQDIQSLADSGMWMLVT
jgi:hypothetical protein